MPEEREQRPGAMPADLSEDVEVELLEDEAPAIMDAGDKALDTKLGEAKAGDVRLKRQARFAGYGALAVAVLALVAVLLAQGLTAALRSTWPMRVAGSGDGPDIRLSVETHIPQPAQPADKQRLARIQEMATSDRSKRPGEIGISPEGRSYLPPQDRDSDTASVITIPISQGRLLRFDEPVESVYIADPQIADIRVVSPLLVYVYGKRLGNTNLLATSTRAPEGSGGEPRLTGSALLRIVADASEPNDAKRFGSPDSQLQVKIIGSRILLNGRLRSIDEAVNAANIGETYSPNGQPPINNTTLVGSNQVNIRVRFAEIARNDLKSFGIDWNVGFKNNSSNIGRNGAADRSNPTLNIGATVGAFNIDVLIDALQSNGDLQILAEPNLTAVTGETAKFLAGGEVPIPIPSGTVSNTNVPGLGGVQYKPFGVALSFTPTLVKENRIALRVAPEVSSITSFTDFAVQGFNFPIFKVSRTETTVEMASGQTFALAGLFQRDVSRSVEKLPVLGDVPVLGALFRSERYKRNESELVILITPYLVAPTRDALFTPLDKPVSDRSDPTTKGYDYQAPERDQSSGFIVR